MTTVVHYQDSFTLRILLDLADDPRHDVKTTTAYGTPAVVVPDKLYQRYLTYQSLLSSPPEVPKKKESVS
jgi:hypothetical protein